MSTTTPGPPALSLPTRGRRAVDPRRRSVLVVDDDDAMRQFLAEALGDEGFSVEEAADGEAAMATIERRAWQPFDVIVIDYRMPHANGMDVLLWTRSRTLSSRLVMISAFADEHVERAARQVGASCVLAKPFALADLLEAVRGPGGARG